MFQKIDSLENMIDRVSTTIQSLKDEKKQIAEELEVVREVLDEKEKEVASLREERELLEQRLSGLLEKMKSTYEISDGSSGWDNPPSCEGGHPDSEGSGHDPSQGETGARQGELTDRF
ncbi:MAG: cell division protein ZapB [Thermovirgaceae bacterium]|nr:cell division protein ZapB [Thermovirgaceae bacterium]